MSQISCMSFNILSCDTHDGGFELPRTRIRHVISVIREQAPDLLGVQEACNLCCEDAENKACKGFDWCAPMIEEMDKLGYDYSILRDQKDFALPRQTIGCGLIIFFKRERFILNESGCYAYRHDFNRYFQWAKLTDKKYNKPILFTNTHLSVDQPIFGNWNPVVGDGYRVVEAYKLLRFWHENCDENTALFATGDYNSTPDSNTQSVLRYGRFKPSYLVTQKPDERGTVHGTLTAHIIDYCYVNPTAQIVTEYHPITTIYESDADCQLKGYPSDHRAIMTYCDYK